MENQEKPQFQIECIEPTGISLYKSNGKAILKTRIEDE